MAIVEWSYHTMKKAGGGGGDVYVLFVVVDGM